MIVHRRDLRSEIARIIDYSQKQPAADESR